MLPDGRKTLAGQPVSEKLLRKRYGVRAACGNGVEIGLGAAGDVEDLLGGDVNVATAGPEHDRPPVVVLRVEGRGSERVILVTILNKVDLCSAAGFSPSSPF